MSTMSIRVTPVSQISRTVLCCLIRTIDKVLSWKTTLPQSTLQTFHDSDEGESAETFNVFFFDDDNRSIVTQPVTINDVDASYTLTPSVSTIDEGDSVSFSIIGTGVPNSGSTTLKYQVIPTASDSADSADFVTGTFTPNFQPVDIRQDSGSFSVQTKVDGDLG